VISGRRKIPLLGSVKPRSASTINSNLSAMLN
jgi:hypothetical protein